LKCQSPDLEGEYLSRWVIYQCLRFIDKLYCNSSAQRSTTTSFMYWACSECWLIVRIALINHASAIQFSAGVINVVLTNLDFVKYALFLGTAYAVFTYFLMEFF